jgi:CheY-like chemotaxis protein
MIKILSFRLNQICAAPDYERASILAHCEGRMLGSERSLQASGETPTQVSGCPAGGRGFRFSAPQDYLPCRGQSRLRAGESRQLDEATKLALQNAFDCISLDLSLGQHGGIEILQYLRDIGCNVPIVIIGGSHPATVHEALRAAKSLNRDICETVMKPVDLDMLRYSFERIRTQPHTAVAAA